MSVHQQGRETSAVSCVNAGIDVAKDWVDACWGDQVQRFAQDADGIKQLAASLSQAAVELVVMEASGGYEVATAAALQADGFAVAVLNPRQARDFAKAMGVLAKTDRVDARVLRDFANVIAAHPQRQRYLRPLPDERRAELAALVVRRRQLVAMRRAEANGWGPHIKRRARVSTPFWTPSTGRSRISMPTSMTACASTLSQH